MNLLPMVGAQASQIQFGKQKPNDHGPKTAATYRSATKIHHHFPLPIMCCDERGEDLLIIGVKGRAELVQGLDRHASNGADVFPVIQPHDL